MRKVIEIGLETSKRLRSVILDLKGCYMDASKKLGIPHELQSKAFDEMNRLDQLHDRYRKTRSLNSCT